MLFFTNCRIRLCVPHNLSLDLFEMKSPLASDTRSSYTHSLETHINPADIGQHTGTRNAKHKSLTQLSLTHTHRYEAPPFPFLALPPLLLFLEGGGVCVIPQLVCSVPHAVLLSSSFSRSIFLCSQVVKTADDTDHSSDGQTIIAIPACMLQKRKKIQGSQRR